MGADVVDLEESRCIFNTGSAYRRRMRRISAYYAQTKVLSDSEPSRNDKVRYREEYRRPFLYVQQVVVRGMYL